MTQSDAAEVARSLSAGVTTVEPLLRRHGFQPADRDASKGSGGPFATIDFLKEDRALYLWLRLSSLSVRYDVRGHRLDHSSYMRELLGPAGGNLFPPHANDAVAAFAALRFDLEHFCGDFLSGDGEAYLRCWTAVKADEQRTGFQRLARIEDRLRQVRNR